MILNKISNGIFRTGVDAGAGEDAVSAMVVDVGADAVDVDDAGREARSWVTLEFCICRVGFFLIIKASDKDNTWSWSADCSFLCWTFYVSLFVAGGWI